MAAERELVKKIENAQINIDGKLYDVMLAKFKQTNTYQGKTKVSYFVSPSKFRVGNKEYGPNIHLILPVRAFSINGYMPTEDEIKKLFKGDTITAKGLNNSKEKNFSRDVKFNPLAKIKIKNRVLNFTGQIEPVVNTSFTLDVIDTLKDVKISVKGKQVVTDILKIKGRGKADYYTTDTIDVPGVKIPKNQIRLYVPIMGAKGFKPNSNEVKDFFAGKVVHGTDMYSVKNDNYYEADLQFDPLAKTDYKFTGNTSFVDSKKK